jgi:hypothetical protein
MIYKELQIALRQFKVEGKTDIKLNSSKEVLEKEFIRVISKGIPQNEIVLAPESGWSVRQGGFYTNGINTIKAHGFAGFYDGVIEVSYKPFAETRRMNWEIFKEYKLIEDAHQWSDVVSKEEIQNGMKKLFIF